MHEHFLAGPLSIVVSYIVSKGKFRGPGSGEQICHSSSVEYMSWGVVRQGEAEVSGLQGGEGPRLHVHGLTESPHDRGDGTELHLWA